MAFLIHEIPYVQEEIYVVLTFMYLIMCIYLSACLPACLPANFIIFLFIRLFISVLVGLIVCSCFLSIFMYVFLKPMLLLNKKSKYALELHVSSALKHELLLLFITRSFALYVFAK